MKYIVEKCKRGREEWIKAPKTFTYREASAVTFLGQLAHPDYKYRMTEVEDETDTENK